MNTDNDKIGSLEEQRLIKTAAQLKASYEPERDLWPEIATAISTLPQSSPRFNWMPYALAASVLISVLSLSFSGYQYFQHNQTKPMLTASNDYISAIEQPYSLARASYLEEMVVQGDKLSPEIRLVIKENLAIIDDAIKTIRHALELDPDNKQLIDKLIQTREQEMAFFRQLTKRRVTTI